MSPKAQALLWAGILSLAASPIPARAASPATATPRLENVQLALIRPGAGFLVADGASIVPLEILVSKPTPSRAVRAKVTARAGKVVEATILESGAVWLRYQTPRPSGPSGTTGSSGPVAESIQVTLSFPEGESVGLLSFEVPLPSPPQVELSLTPEILALAARRERQSIAVEATAGGPGVSSLELAVAPGTLGKVNRTAGRDRLAVRGEVSASALPENEPSCVLAVAAASSALGFSARWGASMLEAELRIDVEIPPRSELIIEGAANAPPPALAGPDGHVIVDHVVVRYGAEVRAFARRGNKKTEVSIAIPSLMSPGLVLAIPGQDVADGGTGPSILVAVPPSPFGDAVLWPEIQVDGARVVNQVQISDALRALVLERPAQPKMVTVLLDEQRAGQIFFGGRHGVSVELSGAPRRAHERAAVEVRVTDEVGAPADAPRPVVRVVGGPTLEPERISRGLYRAALTASVAAAGVPFAPVVAELEPPARVAGAPLEGAKAALSVELGMLDAERARPDRALGPRVARGSRFSLAATAQVGRSFSSLTVFGGGVLGEFRFPFLGDRVAARAGATYVRAIGSGLVSFADDNPARTVVAGVWVPLDLGFAVISNEDFELALRGGATLRFEQGVVRVDGDVAAGGDRFAVSGQGSIDAAFSLGSGAFFLGATADGIGATADGFASSGRALRGSLMSVRGDFGYKYWF